MAPGKCKGNLVQQPLHTSMSKVREQDLLGLHRARAKGTSPQSNEI
jgi:hypothetical protein